jgi:hypothetical protein
VLVEHQAVGHTTLAQYSNCTHDIVLNYLLNSQVGVLSDLQYRFGDWALMSFFSCSCRLSSTVNAHRIQTISSLIPQPMPAWFCRRPLQGFLSQFLTISERESSSSSSSSLSPKVDWSPTDAELNPPPSLVHVLFYFCSIGYGEGLFLSLAGS